MKRTEGGHNGQEEQNLHRWTGQCRLWSGRAGTEKLTLVCLIITEPTHWFVSSSNKWFQNSSCARRLGFRDAYLHPQAPNLTGHGRAESDQPEGVLTRGRVGCGRDEPNGQGGSHTGGQLRPGIRGKLLGQRKEPGGAQSCEGWAWCEGAQKEQPRSLQQLSIMEGLSTKHYFLPSRNLNLAGNTGHLHGKGRQKR